MKSVRDRDRQCVGKRRYSKHQAEKTRIACMKRQNRKIRIYQCEICHQYHLTSHHDYRL